MMLLQSSSVHLNGFVQMEKTTSCLKIVLFPKTDWKKGEEKNNKFLRFFNALPSLSFSIPPPSSERRCTLGQYVEAAFGLSWDAWLQRLAQPNTWADAVVLFGVSEAFNCCIVVCSKMFPAPDFFVRFGENSGPELLLSHWQGFQFRSMIPKHEWDELYEEVKALRGVKGMDHRLYSGLLRYQERTEEAILHCQMEIEDHPNSLVGHHTWSIVLSDSFQSGPAMQHYLSQLEIAPNHPHSYNGVGTTLHDLRRFEEAIFFYKAQLFFNPLNKYSHLNMSLAYARLKRYEDAEREHRVQLMLHPTDRNSCDYFLELLGEMKKPEMGVQFFKDLVEKEPWRNDWRIHLARAHVMMKDYLGAGEQLKMVLRNNPCDSRALTGLAELLERNGYYARAAKLLEKVVRLFPRHPRVRSFLGDCEVKSANYDRARQVLTEQIEMFPSDSEAYSRMAELCAQTGETDQAIALYKKARTVDPTDSSCLFNIGLCYLDLHNYNEAREYFQRHLGENPDDPMSLLEVANTYYATGQLDMSIRGYRAVLQVKPDHTDCRVWLAATLTEAGRLDEAIQEYLTLIETTKKNSYHYNVSYVYQMMADRSQEPEETRRLRRLGDIHCQLETGVPRRYIDAFYEALDSGTLGKHNDPPISSRRLAARSPIFVREDSLPYGVTWSPAVHHLCSRLAKKQVMMTMLLLLRVEKKVGYAFPRDLKYRIIREMLASPTEDFVRSVVPSQFHASLFDDSDTVCLRPVADPEKVLTDLAAANAPVMLTKILYWPRQPSGEFAAFPLDKKPASGDFEAAVYLKLRDVDEVMRSVQVNCSVRTCTPAEMTFIPYDKCNLTKADVQPYEGAVTLFVHQFRNRQMYEVAMALRGQADEVLSLDLAASFALGREAEVKKAIHDLLMDCLRIDRNLMTYQAPVISYNSAMVVALFLVRWGLVDGERDGESEWVHHFSAVTDYSKILVGCAELVVRAAPVGEMLYRLGLVLLDIAESLPAESDGRKKLLPLAIEALRVRKIGM
jgi:tetratricopeptide (TPR) repeat protein